MMIIVISRNVDEVSGVPDIVLGDLQICSCLIVYLSG